MKRNIAQIMACAAAAGLLIGVSAAWAADNDKDQQQQNQQSQTDQQSQSGTQSSTSSQTSPSDQSQSQSQTGAEIGEASGASSQAATDPQAFIKEAYQQNQTEIQLGQLAQQKGQSSDVKEFGQHLVQGHQAINDKLKQLGDQKNVQLTAQLDAKHQRMVDECSNLSGADFDKKFMHEQIRAHRKAISLYQQAADRNSDAQVKEFAQSNLPALKQHLQMAQQHSSAIGEPAGAQTSQDQQSQTGQQGQQGQDQQQQQQQPEQKQP